MITAKQFDRAIEQELKEAQTEEEIKEIVEGKIQDYAITVDSFENSEELKRKHNTKWMMKMLDYLERLSDKKVKERNENSLKNMRV